MSVVEDSVVDVKEGGGLRKAKRGLSKFYGGKSKSFGNLGEVKSMKELRKADNPFNKRRRTVMAYSLMFKNNAKTKDEKIMNENSNRINKYTKNISGLFYAHSNHISMPLLPLAEVDDDDDNVVDDSSDDINCASSSLMASHNFQQLKEKKILFKC
ncbi:hypothetical protein RDABS01_039279 [Bienertia sinuspersici]